MISGCGRSAGAVIPALGSGRYSPGPYIVLPSWLKDSDPNCTLNVFWGQPGALATVSFYATFIADFRGAKSTHIPHRQLHSFSRNADALCEVIVHPIDPRATPLLRGRHPRHSLQEPSRAARQARAMAFRNAEGQRGKYLTLELSSTRNPVEDMYAIVSKFQSAKIGVQHRNVSRL